MYSKKVLSLEELKRLQGVTEVVTQKGRVRVVRHIYTAILDKQTCLLGDVLITTKDGEKPISEVSIGEEVLGKDGFFPVIAKSRTVRPRYLKVFLSNGRVLKLTPDHRVLVGNVYKRADRLRVGDRLSSVQECAFCRKLFVERNLLKRNWSKEGGNRGKRFCSVRCYRGYQQSGAYEVPSRRTGVMVTCPVCGEDFYRSRSSTRKFCSRECYLRNHSKYMREVPCKVCGRLHRRGKKGLEKDNHFCSRECYLSFREGNIEYNRNLVRNTMKDKVEVSCSFCGKKLLVTERQLSYYKRKFCSQECYWKWMRKKPDECYNEWRRQVFKRDRYTCQICGVNNENSKNVYLNAHHIKPKRLFPELKFSVENGITLCVDCHAEVHKRQPQLYNFILNQKDRLCQLECSR